MAPESPEAFVLNFGPVSAPRLPLRNLRPWQPFPLRILRLVSPKSSNSIKVWFGSGSTVAVAGTMSGSSCPKLVRSTFVVEPNHNGALTNDFDLLVFSRVWVFEFIKCKKKYVSLAWQERCFSCLTIWDETDFETLLAWVMGLNKA